MTITRGAVLTSLPHERPYVETTPLQFLEVELSEPQESEVLVRLEAAGLCHSDLSVVNGNRPRPVPMLLGHEAAGTVEKVGPGVDESLVGRRVVATFLPRCGECDECQADGKLPCSVGSVANGEGVMMSGGTRLTHNGEPILHHLGVSGFATYAIMDTRSIVPVDSDVPPPIAAILGCAVLTGGGAVLNAGKPTSKDTVAIVGMGGVGMAALLVALGSEAKKVIAVDALDSKLELAKELGAHEAYTPDQVSEQGIKASIVIEAAGHEKAFETAYTMTAPGGTTVTAGLPHPEATSTIRPVTLTAEARTVIGSYLGSAVPSRDIPTYVDMWRAGKLPLEKLITDTITLDDLNEALDNLAEGKSLRQIIDFTK